MFMCLLSAMTIISRIKEPEARDLKDKCEHFLKFVSIIKTISLLIYYTM